MGGSEIFFGRNILIEALRAHVEVTEVFTENPKAADWAYSVLKEFGVRVPVSQGLPKSKAQSSHQGVAFRVHHDFYTNEIDFGSEEFSKIVLCNHLEDVQNLGAICRSAAAFGFNAIIHEKRRSFHLSEAAVKASAGLAFSLKFMEVSNLTPLAKKLQDRFDFDILALDMEGAVDLYEYQPSDRPMALIVGSEGEGVSRPLQKLLNGCVQIPMAQGVESLNAAQAASIAMSWLSYRASKA